MERQFLDRIYGEFQAYKADILGCTNVEIFNRCYEIDAIINFYEILVEESEQMQDHELEALLECEGLLDGLYSLWLKRDDSAYSEMRAHVNDEIRSMTKRKFQEKEA